jgi:tetratricopeptide (TPR) repeat protein
VRTCEHELAMVDLAKALTHKPRHEAALVAHATASLACAQTLLALDLCDRALAVNSRNALAHAVRGCANGRIRHHARAFADFERAFSLGGLSEEALLTYAAARVRLRIELAQVSNRPFIRASLIPPPLCLAPCRLNPLSSASSTVRTGGSRTHRGAVQYDAAIAEATALIEDKDKAGRCAEMLVCRADAHCAKRSWHLAVEDYAAALRLEPLNTEVRAALLLHLSRGPR